MSNYLSGSSRKVLTANGSQSALTLSNASPALISTTAMVGQLVVSGATPTSIEVTNPNINDNTVVLVTLETVAGSVGDAPLIVTVQTAAPQLTITSTAALDTGSKIHFLAINPK